MLELGHLTVYFRVPPHPVHLPDVVHVVVVSSNVGVLLVHVTQSDAHVFVLGVDELAWRINVVGVVRMHSGTRIQRLSRVVPTNGPKLETKEARHQCVVVHFRSRTTLAELGSEYECDHSLLENRHSGLCCSWPRYLSGIFDWPEAP